jgi:N-acyl homoserine lactone hydrolase
MKGKIVKKIYMVIAVTVLVLLSLGIIANMSARLTAQSFQQKKPSAKNWEDVFAHKQDIELVTLSTGTIVCKRSGVLNLKNPLTSQLKDEEITIPALAHLIRHKKYGDFLIDTGFAKLPAGSRKGDMKGIFVPLIGGKYIQEPNQDIASQLQQKNVKLQGVFFTHLHPDHVAGTPALPDDIQYVYGKNEKYINYKFLFYGDHLKGKKNLYAIDFTTAGSMPFLGQCVDIFGDGSVWAISTPGHSTDHISYLINQNTGPVLLTGDASITKWGFANGVEPGTFSSDIEISKNSLLKLIQFVKAYPQVKVVYGHEF